MPPRVPRPCVLFLQESVQEGKKKTGRSARTFSEAVPTLTQDRWVVRRWSGLDTRDADLLRWAAEADVIVSGAIASAVTAEATAQADVVYAAMAQASRCRLFQIPFTGYEQVDWGRVPAHITVCNTFGMEPGIAEYVIAAVMGWSSGIWRQSRQLQDGGDFTVPWTSPQKPLGREVAGRTLGVVGLGHIGAAVARKAAALGMRVIAVRRSAAAAPPPGVEWVRPVAGGLLPLLRESDFVCLACDLNDATRGLIGDAELRAMRGDAVLINVARGPVVDEGALYAALSERRIGGAVIDVWWKYPTADGKGDRSPSSHPFHTLPNVIVTPHSSGWTEGFPARRHAEVARNLDQVASGGALRSVVPRPDAPAAAKL